MQKRLTSTILASAGLSLLLLPLVQAGCTSTTIIQQVVPDGGASGSGNGGGTGTTTTDGGAPNTDAGAEGCSDDGSDAELRGYFDKDPDDPEYWKAIVVGSSNDCRFCWDIDVIGPNLKSNGDTFRTKRVPSGAIALHIYQPKYPTTKDVAFFYYKDGRLFSALGDGSEPNYESDIGTAYRRASRGYTCDGEKP